MTKRNQEGSGLEPCNVQALIRNVESIFKNEDISRLNKPTYNFIILHMGFIAHYDLSGFQSTYRDLREFCLKLQTSEYGQDKENNLREAGRQETDGDFKKWYGEERQKSVAEAMRGIVNVARKYEDSITKKFDERQKAQELELAGRMAEKYGYEIRRIK